MDSRASRAWALGLCPACPLVTRLAAAKVTAGGIHLAAGWEPVPAPALALESYAQRALDKGLVLRRVAGRVQGQAVL